MAVILTTSPAKTILRPARLLLLASTSSLVLGAQPLAANQLLFTTADVRLQTGERIDQRGGLTQIALTGGGTVSIVDAAKYRLNADGSIDLYEGAITVAAGGGGGGEVLVRMPQGLEGRVAGSGTSGNFVVRANGEASGHALTGTVAIGRAGATERFAAGEMWRAKGDGDVRRVVANDAQVQPSYGGGGGERFDPRADLVAPQPGSVAPSGAGLRADVTGNLDFDLEVAVPLTEPRYDTGDRQPRINLRVSQSF